MRSFIIFGLFFMIGALGAYVFVGSSNKTQAETANVPAFVTDTPSPTPNPYKIDFKNQLNNLNSEITNYQNSIVANQEDFNSTKTNMTNGKYTGLPASIIMALLQNDNNEMAEDNARIAYDSNKIDELNAEKAQIESELAQMGGN